MRKIYVLDKGWRFSETAEMVMANSHSDSYSSSKAGGCTGPAGLRYDDSEWRLLDIPHDRLCETDFSPEASHSHGYKNRENFWYRKTFTMDEKYEGWHFLLCFEGVSVFSEIYVNGSLLEHSYSAYCEIPVDITDRIHFGTTPNVISVHINGFAEEGWWYEGAGIYRHVKLYAKPPVHIAHNGIWAKPVLKEGTDNDWTVEMLSEIENSGYDTENAEVRAKIIAPDGREYAVSTQAVCGENAVTSAAGSIDINDPERWDVDSPVLYKAVFELYQNGELKDMEETHFGFRTIAVDAEKGFLLNGRHVLIKGTCNHQDHAGVGVAVPDSVQEYRIKRLKDMGTNAYRCSHNMPAKEILDACDKYGMIVMDENRRFESSRDVINQVRTLIKRDRNHPSVIFYSLFNEEPLQNTNEGKRIYKRLRSEAMKLDNTRIVMGAIDGVHAPEDGTALDMDITGFNYRIDSIPVFHKMYPWQPVIGSENNSTISTRGCYRTDMDKQVLACYDEEKVPWGQTARETWALLRDNPYIAGLFIWTGFDYRGEPTPFKYPACSSQFGVMDTCGFAKDGFYFNKSFFVDEPMMHILPHWNHKKGDIVRVMAVTNCQESELFLNGKSLGKKVSDVCEPAEWMVEFEPGELCAVGYNCGVEAVREEICTTGKPAAVELDPQMDVLKNDGQHTVPVNVYAVDENGRRVPEASDMIEFELVGDGIILGGGNGNPQALEADDAPYHSLFAGSCQVLVQSKVGASSVTLKARAKGLKPAEYSFSIEDTETPNYLYNEDCRIMSGWTVSAETFAERPDPNMVVADDDMNSFEPVDIKLLVKYQESGWKIYRTFFTTPYEGEQFAKFPSVECEKLEVYVNGEQFADIDSPKEAEQVKIKALKGEKNEIRVLCKVSEGAGIAISGDITVTKVNM